MNKVFLIGRITKDLELRYTTTGTPVVNFNLAINRPKDKNGESTADYPSIIVWNKLAENLAKYQSKGSLIAVDGKVQTRTREVDGQKQYITEIVANGIEFLGSKPKEVESEMEELSPDSILTDLDNFLD